MNPSDTPALIQDKYALPFWRWLALAAALLAWGFDGVEQGVYSIMTRAALKDLIPGLSGDIKAMDAEVGKFFSWSLAMWLWGAAAGGVLFGRLGDRIGRVRGLIIAVVTYASFTGISALSTHWSHLIVCRFFGALGLGGTWPLCVALVVETWPENRRAVLAGAIGAAANVGYLIAAIYSGYMLEHNYTWRWVIGMGFFIGISSLLVIVWVPEPTKWKLSRQTQQKSSLGELFTPQFRRSTIVGSLLSTVALLGTWGAFLWLPTYVDQLTEGTVLAATGKATITKWQCIGQISGGFIGGVLAGWMGNRRSWLMLCLGAWVTVLGVFGLNKTFDLQLKLSAVLAAFFVTSFFGWLPKYLPELYPTRIRASGQGFSYNIGRVLAGVGVLGTGYLVAAFKGNYSSGVMVTASIYLLGLLVIWFAPDTGGKMREDGVGSPVTGPGRGLEAAAAARPERDV